MKSQESLWETEEPLQKGPESEGQKMSLEIELNLRNPGQLKGRCVPKNPEALLPVPYSQGVCR